MERKNFVLTNSCVNCSNRSSNRRPSVVVDKAKIKTLRCSNIVTEMQVIFRFLNCCLAIRCRITVVH